MQTLIFLFDVVQNVSCQKTQLNFTFDARNVRVQFGTKQIKSEFYHRLDKALMY